MSSFSINVAPIIPSTVFTCWYRYDLMMKKKEEEGRRNKKKGEKKRRKERRKKREEGRKIEVRSVRTVP